jgi:hypothetical protein
LRVHTVETRSDQTRAVANRNNHVYRGDLRLAIQNPLAP